MKWCLLIIILLLMSVLQQVFYNYIFFTKEKFMTIEDINRRNMNIIHFKKEVEKVMDDLKKEIKNSSEFVSQPTNLSVNDDLSKKINEYNNQLKELQTVKNNILTSINKVNKELNNISNLTRDKMKELNDIEFVKIESQTRLYFDNMNMLKIIIKDINDLTVLLNKSVGNNGDFRINHELIG
jgi:hypothetical protein